MRWLSVILLVTYCNIEFASAQEHWDSYMARIDGKPGSVLVDMGLYAKAPDTRYPFLVITGPKANNCDKNGLPAKTEFNDLEKVLDATTDFLTGVTVRVLTGTFTYNCERLNYYYVKDTTGVRTAIQRLYRRNFPGYDYVLTMKSDPSWRTYLNFLYPTDDMQNWMENEKVISKMLDAGDSLSTKRDILFEAAFPSDSTLNFFKAFVLAKGYEIKKTDTLPKKYSTERITVSRYAAVKNDSINVWTLQLKQEIKKDGGLYNGWRAPLK